MVWNMIERWPNWIVQICGREKKFAKIIFKFRERCVVVRANTVCVRVLYARQCTICMSGKRGILKRSMNPSSELDGVCVCVLTYRADYFTVRV